MKPDYRLLAGPVAVAVFAIGMIGLPLLVPGYDPVRQTVSEIGEMGSPARIPFAAMLCLVAAGLIVFAWAVRDAARAAGRRAWAAWFIAFMALPAAGIGVFAYPHPLHNWFGLSELVGYQAPLVMAISWRGGPSEKRIAAVSWLMAALVWVAILANLTTFARHGPIWAAVGPVYGLVQRGLFATWFVWCAIVGVMLFRVSAADNNGS